MWVNGTSLVALSLMIESSMSGIVQCVVVPKNMDHVHDTKEQGATRFPFEFVFNWPPGVLLDDCIVLKFTVYIHLNNSAVRPAKP